VPNVLVVMWWWQRDVARAEGRTAPMPTTVTPAE
jgi:hypothetical protein